jgi:cell division protein FtsW
LIGLLFVFEASAAESMALTDNANPYLIGRNQSIRAVLGLIAAGVAMAIPLSFWKRLGGLIYIGAVGLLVLVITPGIRTEINGAYRWLSLGGLAFQPVEVLKLALVTYFPSWLEDHQRVLPFAAMTGLPLGLLLLQPDLGSSLIVAAITGGLYFLAGADLKHLSLLGTLGVVLVAIAIIVSPYRRERVMTFLDPSSDPLDSSFQIRQITIALGNGGLWGEGLGNSKQKFAYIPEASTDSIFAIVGEELGFVGATVMLLLFAGFITTQFRLVKDVEDPYTRLLGFGILLWIGSQIILNLSAIVALVPLTGLPLPFFSYGGSSLITTLFACGLVARIGLENSQ